MTVSISTLQEELLQLFNQEHNTEIQNNDEVFECLTGGQNISEMVDNILAGGNKQTSSTQDNENKHSSSTSINDNKQLKSTTQLNDENKHSSSTSINSVQQPEPQPQSPAETITDILLSNTPTVQHSSSSSSSSDDDESDDEYLNIINEYKTLSGGSTHNSVKVVSYFPYVLKG